MFQIRDFVKNGYILILTLYLFSCQEKGTKDLIVGNWKLAPTTEQQIDIEESATLQLEPPELSLPPPPGIPYRGISFTFLNDSVVDTRREYYKVTRSYTEGREYRFLGTTTKYKIVGDSLKIYNLTDSVWESGKLITMLTDDTLTLTGSDGKKMVFLRNEYILDKDPLFDQIALSSSGCFGSCPIINIIIKSSGDVVYYGEMYVDKLGFYETHISEEEFSRIESEFRKADILKLKKEYSVSWTDDEAISTTFCNRDTIINSIEDYGKAGPDELVWAYPSLRYLFQDLQLRKIDSTQLPPYLDLHFFKFEIGNEVCALTQSESFLLWDYLRKGKIAQFSFEETFTLRFVRNYTWSPSYHEIENPYNKEKEEMVKKIVTDGRYYTFDLVGQKPLTIDIGFNYLSVNNKTFQFREKNGYD